MLPKFSVPNSIVHILNKFLLNNEADIRNAYSCLLSNAGNQKHFAFRGESSQLKDPFSKLLDSFSITPTTKAIDLPVLLKSSDSKPTIVVCAMDSLPPEPESDYWLKNALRPDEGVQLWIPFSLCEPWNSPKGSMASNLNFFKPLIEAYNVYVTDIFKLFFRISSNGKYLKSNQIPAYQNLISGGGVNIHKLILKEEISVLKPAAIVTLGSAATNKLFDLSVLKPECLHNSFKNSIPAYSTPFDIPHFPIPHISNAANGAKTKFINQFNLARIAGQSPNTVIAKYLIQSINNC